jgi:hypothetical protein
MKILKKINYATAISIFFRQMAEKGSMIFVKKLQKQTF